MLMSLCVYTCITFHLFISIEFHWLSAGTYRWVQGILQKIIWILCSASSPVCTSMKYHYSFRVCNHPCDLMTAYSWKCCAWLQMAGHHSHTGWWNTVLLPYSLVATCNCAFRTAVRSSTCLVGHESLACPPNFWCEFVFISVWVTWLQRSRGCVRGIKWQICSLCMVQKLEIGCFISYIQNIFLISIFQTTTYLCF